MPKFFSGYAGNGAQRLGRWFVDRALPGNQRAADGTLNNAAVAYGLGGRALGVLGGLYGGPLVGSGVNKFTGGVIDRLAGTGAPQGLPAGFPTTQTGYGVNLPDYMGGNGVGGPEFSHVAPSSGVNVPNIGFNPSIGGIGAPQVGGSAPQDWTGSLAGDNPFGGQYGGNLGLPTMPTVNAHRPTGGALNFSGGPGGYNNGTGAGTGFGAFNVSNGSWHNDNGGLNMGAGDAALGFGLGTGYSSGGSQALSDAMKAAKINRV